MLQEPSLRQKKPQFQGFWLRNNADIPVFSKQLS